MIFTKAHAIHGTFSLRPMWAEVNNRGDIFCNVIKHAIQIERATEQSKGFKLHI